MVSFSPKDRSECKSRSRFTLALIFAPKLVPKVLLAAGADTGTHAHQPFFAVTLPNAIQEVLHRQPSLEADEYLPTKLSMLDYARLDFGLR